MKINPISNNNIHFGMFRGNVDYLRKLMHRTNFYDNQAGMEALTEALNDAQNNDTKDVFLLRSDAEWRAALGIRIRIYDCKTGSFQASIEFRKPEDLTTALKFAQISAEIEKGYCETVRKEKPKKDLTTAKQELETILNTIENDPHHMKEDIPEWEFVRQIKR